MTEGFKANISKSFLSLCFSLSLSVSLYFCPSLSVSLSPCTPVSVSLSACLSVCLYCHALNLPLSLTHTHTDTSTYQHDEQVGEGCLEGEPVGHHQEVNARQVTFNMGQTLC